MHPSAPPQRRNIEVTVDADGPAFHWTDRATGADAASIVVSTMTEARQVAMSLCGEVRDVWAAHTRFCHAATRADVQQPADCAPDRRD